MEKSACYIRGILRNRISYVDYPKALAWLVDALESGPSVMMRKSDRSERARRDRDDRPRRDDGDYGMGV